MNGSSSREPAPRIVVTPSVRVGAGSRTDLVVTLTNDAAAPRLFQVVPIGIDATWGAGPLRTAVVAPGDAVTLTLAVAPPTGTLPAQYPFAVHAQALVPDADPTRERPADAPVAVADGTIVVSPRTALEVGAEPLETTFVRSRRVRVQLANRSVEPVAVDLGSTASKGLDVRLRRTRLTLAPGAEATVRGRLVATRPRRFGAPLQHHWSITATAEETVRRVRGNVVQRPAFGSGWVRAVAFLAVVAVWAAAAFVLVPRLADRVNERAKEEAIASGASTGQGADGAGADGADGAAGGSKVQVRRSSTRATQRGVQLSGTVTGTDPAGVTVRLRQESLSSASLDDATPVGFDVALAAAGKTLSTSLLVRAPRLTSPDRSATTTKEGIWAFPEVPAPGYYLLTFSKVGFATQKYVIDSSRAESTQPLEIEMVPGEGALRGSVTGPRGLLGGAEVTISDGVSTLTTSTASRGADRGTWSVSGLETPGSYTVEVRSDGLATASALVSLPAQGSRVVDLSLEAGTATLIGFAADATGTTARQAARARNGIGGISVVVTDTQGARFTTTSLTASEAGDELEGRFVVPGLRPGRYTATLSGAGFLTQTRRIDVRPGDAEVGLTTGLRSSLGRVVGTIRDADTEVPTGENAGLVLTNAGDTYKTTAATATTAAPDSAGTFEFNNIEPGVYTLSVTLFGFTTDTLTVEVPGGATVRANPRLRVVPNGGLKATSRIVGAAVEADTGDQIECPADPVDPTQSTACLRASLQLPNGGALLETTFKPDQEYTLPDADDGVEGLEPGLYRVEVFAPGYELREVPVSVGLDQDVLAADAELLRSPLIRGTISAAAGLPSAPTCVWVVPDDQATGFDPACVPADCETVGNIAQTPDRTPLCDVVQPGVGEYRIRTARRGSYQLFTTPVDPQYAPIGAQPVSALPASTTVLDLKLDRYGIVRVITKEPDDAINGNLSVAPASVSLIPGGGGATRVLTTGNDGAGTYLSLPSGTYTLSASNLATDPDEQRASDPQSITVGFNQDVTYTLVMVDDIRSIAARVYTYLTSTPERLQNVSVAITGIIGYNGDTAITRRLVLTTGSDGCVVVLRDATIDRPDSTNCPAGFSSAASLALQRFVSSTATIDITASGYDRILQTGVELLRNSPTAINEYELQPTVKPLSDTLRIEDFANAAVNFAAVNFSVVPVNPAPNTPAITLSAAANGQLTWNDPRYPLGRIRPGTYTVSASLAGYMPITQTFTCTVAASACTTAAPVSVGGQTVVRSLTLRRLAALGVTVTDSNGNGVPGATVTLKRNGTAVSSLDTTNLTATFTELPLDDGAVYTVDVRAAGHAFLTDAPLTSCLRPGTFGQTFSSSVVLDPGKTTTCTVRLTRLATLTGSITEITTRNSVVTRTRLFNEPIEARRCTATAIGSFGTYCTTVADAGITGTTDALGTFRLTGTKQVEGITSGFWLLIPRGDTYEVPPQPGAASGAPAGFPVQVPSGVLVVNTDLEVNTRTVDFTVNVVDQFNRPVSGLTVELLTANVREALAVGTGGSYLFAGMAPATYDLQVSGPGIITSTQSVEIRRNAATQTLRYPVSRPASRLNGIVTGTDVTGGLADATVDLLACTTLSATTCTTTAAEGIDGEPLTQQTTEAGRYEFITIPDGFFAVRFSKDGYQPITAGPFQFSTTGAAPPAVSATLQHVRRDVEITITPTVATNDLSGTVLTLTPSNTDLGRTTLTATLPAGSVGTSLVRFSSVHHGCYRLTVTLPPLHYGRVTLPPDGTGVCTRNVVVPTTPSVATPLAFNVGVEESRLTLDVTSVPQLGHPVATPVRLRVTGTGVSYDETLPVPGGATTVTLWVRPLATTVSLAATGGFVGVFWPDVSATVTAAELADGSHTEPVALTEITSRLRVTAAGAGPASEALVTIAPGAGQTASVPAAYTGGVLTSGGVADLDLPSGRWVIDATRVDGTTTVTYVAQTVNLTALTASLTLAEDPPPPTPPGGGTP
ncbi:hypothetical protein [Nocardioides sp.]|uniref:hypothetical protein n=1 Tax=Nocardioides sp. TaxID=35761 RepID=UPI0035154B2B